MKTSEYIVDKINRFPKNYVFTYMDFTTEVNKREAIIKHLNRMVASGKINKLSKGKYYKQQDSVFGVLLPEQYQIVKDLLEDGEKRIGYITGYSVYNSLGLTTQISNVIQIGSQQTRASFKRGRFTIAFIKQKNIITKENIKLLQLLDAIRYIKKIPDTNIDTSYNRLKVLLKTLSITEKEQIVRLAYKYPPSTRALLGSLLEAIGSLDKTALETLKKTLNPITIYTFSISENVIPNADHWNIK